VPNPGSGGPGGGGGAARARKRDRPGSGVEVSVVAEASSSDADVFVPVDRRNAYLAKGIAPNLGKFHPDRDLHPVSSGVDLHAEVNAATTLQPENDVAFTGRDRVEDDLALGNDDRVADCRIGHGDTRDHLIGTIRICPPDRQVETRYRTLLRERAVRASHGQHKTQHTQGAAIHVDLALQGGGSFRVVRLASESSDEHHGRPFVESFFAVSANFCCCTSRPRMIVTVLVSAFGFGGGGAWTTGVATG